MSRLEKGENIVL